MRRKPVLSAREDPQRVRLDASIEKEPCQPLDNSNRRVDVQSRVLGVVACLEVLLDLVCEKVVPLLLECLHKPSSGFHMPLKPDEHEPHRSELFHKLELHLLILRNLHEEHLNNFGCSLPDCSL